MNNRTAGVFWTSVLAAATAFELHSIITGRDELTLTAYTRRVTRVVPERPGHRVAGIGLILVLRWFEAHALNQSAQRKPLKDALRALGKTAPAVVAEAIA